MRTDRQQIIDILINEEMTARELSQSVRISEKKVYEHLSHIAKSVSAQGKKLILTPPECLDCGFVFKDRDRFTPPSRCPRCKQTHLSKPAYRIS